MQFVTWWHGRKLPQPSLNCCCVKSIGKHIVEWNTLIATDLTVILSTGPLNQPSLPCRDPAVLWSSHRHKSVLHGDTTVWSTCILHLVTYTQIWYIFICVYDCVCLYRSPYALFVDVSWFVYLYSRWLVPLLGGPWNQRPSTPALVALWVASHPVLCRWTGRNLVGITCVRAQWRELATLGAPKELGRQDKKIHFTKFVC